MWMVMLLAISVAVLVEAIPYTITFKYFPTADPTCAKGYGTANSQAAGKSIMQTANLTVVTDTCYVPTSAEIGPSGSYILRVTNSHKSILLLQFSDTACKNNSTLPWKNIATCGGCNTGADYNGYDTTLFWYDDPVYGPANASQTTCVANGGVAVAPTSLALLSLSLVLLLSLI